MNIFHSHAVLLRTEYKQSLGQMLGSKLKLVLKSRASAIALSVTDNVTFLWGTAIFGPPNA
jgi:hypothetical protein